MKVAIRRPGDQAPVLVEEPSQFVLLEEIRNLVLRYELTAIQLVDGQVAWAMIDANGQAGVAYSGREANAAAYGRDIHSRPLGALAPHFEHHTNFFDAAYIIANLAIEHNPVEYNHA